MSTTAGTHILLRERPRVLNRLLDSAELDARGIDGSSLALSDGTDTLDFDTYTDRVARLGAGLIGLGVRPGDRVGVHLFKSAHAFVAVHAVLHAGAVMVPLDAFAPTAHVDQQIADAGLTTLVTDADPDRLRALLTDSPIRAVVQRDAPSTDGGDGVTSISWSEVERLEPAPPVDVEPDDPAYIIYTSGSTGTPKGIVHTHRSALAYAEAAAATYALRSDDRLANIAALHFDQSTFELYAAPLVGAATIVVPDAVLRFPASLAEFIEREGATVWYSVPFVLRQLLARGALERRDLSHLRWVLYGGEAFPPDELGELMRRVSSARFSNVYGPAEVNQCTYHHLDRPPPLDRAVPLGTHWPAARVSIVPLDGSEPTPVSHEEHDGEPGELLVASATMMAGYWQRPEQTAAVVVEGDDGERWYRTGDVVRRDRTGHLEFLGRVDNQVKVRGQRVELEAVDATLIAAPGVRDGGVAVVDGGEHARVVAAAVLDEGATIAPVWEHLRARLPNAAVPADIMVVSMMPRTGNGKVDRPAIVEITAGSSGTQRSDASGTGRSRATSHG